MDFRSSRTKLDPDCFALHPEGPEPEPTDIIEKEIWDGIIWLTDDVSLRTSDDFGTELKAMHEIWAESIEMLSKIDDSWFHIILDTADNFQAAIFNALCGYYKVANSCLRIAVENMAIGTYLQLERNVEDTKKWQNGSLSISFAKACDGLIKSKGTKSFEDYLHTEHKYSFFQQRKKDRMEGFVRRLFGELSNFSHANPKYSDGIMWDGSNGPIFVKRSFGNVYSQYLNVAFSLFILTKINRPEYKRPDCSKWIFESRNIQSPDFLLKCFNYLFE